MFRFVRYQDCVLPEEMIGSGSMERIRDFKARSGDVFVSSFPNSGTTWVQEVVNQLMICQCCKDVRQLQDPTEQKAVDSIVNCDLILNSVRNFCLLFFYCNLILNSVCSFSFSNFFSNHYPQSVATYEVSSQQKNSLLQRILQDCNN